MFSRSEFIVDCLPLRFGIFQVAYENLVVDGSPMFPRLEEMDAVQVGYVHTPRTRKYQLDYFLK